MTDDPQSHYALSFTSGGLLVREGGLVATIHLESIDWKFTRARIIDGNLLQAGTTSSLIRLTRETIQRVAALSADELALLVEGSPTEQQHLMWVAACRRYALIGDFAEEVLRERFLLMKPTLDSDDFDRFVTGKSLWHPELDGLKPSTRQRLRQTLFQMLREAGLRTGAGEIVPAVMSPRVTDMFDRRTPSDLRFFPTSAPFTISDDQGPR